MARSPATSFVKPSSPVPPAAESMVILERWYQRFRETAEALAKRLLGDAEEARDAVQQAFLAALRTEAKAEDPTRAWAWLSRVVTNTCRDRLRARRVRERPWPEQERRLRQGELADPAETAEARHRAERVAAALARLPVALREIVELKHYAELSFSEVAAALNQPIPTVKSRFARALDLLRIELRSLDS